MTPHLLDEAAQLAAMGSVADAAAGQHLVDCERCRALVGGYERIGAALAALDRPQAPAGFAAGVLARIEARRQRARRQLLAISAALVSLGGAALVGLVCSSSFGAVLASLAREAAAASSILSQLVEIGSLPALRLPLALLAALWIVPLALALDRRLLFSPLEPRSAR